MQTTVARELDDSFKNAGEWDRLLSGSDSNTIFLTSGWLRAWRETIGQTATLVVPQIRIDGRLVGAAAFECDNGIIRFAGRGPSDYADFVVSREVDPALVPSVITKLLDEAMRATAGFRHFELARIPASSRSLEYLQRARPQFFSTVVRAMPAPCLRMSAVESKLQKKGLRRLERVLHRQGTLVCRTYTSERDILPLLDGFFDQHIERWSKTDFPSLFLESVNRDFYRALVQRLDTSNALRFTELRLGDRLIAAHFGFMHGDTFTFYKPTYAPSLAEFSPGQVLLRQLLEHVRDEGARLFDFGIGNETYKLRFATTVPEAVYFHVTNSRSRALHRRLFLEIGRALSAGAAVVRGRRDRATNLLNFAAD
jgi:CelD/BcsL family acetyltransferase involved in cellulose biosynthesis